MSETLDLLDYRRRVNAIYDRVRSGEGKGAWERWRAERDELFRTHPQTPIEDPESFTGIHYFDYDEKWRTTGTLRPADHDQDLDVTNSGADSTPFKTVGTVRFTLDGHDAELELLWLTSYGGGLFLPFRDLTNGDATYGGGRYLLDTVKGADLGHEGEVLTLDFNFAYHPSCVHSYRWSCPLAPPSNRLDFAVTAGERLQDAS